MAAYEKLSHNQNVVYHKTSKTSDKYNNYLTHEWIFINLLCKYEIKKDITIAKKFMTYMIEYYPEYKWTSFDLNDPIGTVILECDLTDKIFTGINIFKDMEEAKTKAMEYGEKVTDFLIRYSGYSLIKCQNENIIITAQSNCDKIFEEELYRGYSLQRKSKLRYVEADDIIKKAYPLIDGYFTHLPVLPTKKLGIEIDEMIENSDGVFVKVK